MITESLATYVLLSNCILIFGRSLGFLLGAARYQLRKPELVCWIVRAKIGSDCSTISSAAVSEMRK